MTQPNEPVALLPCGQYSGVSTAGLASLLRQAADDLHPYSLGEVDAPSLNAALPAYLNEAALRLTARVPLASADTAWVDELERLANDVRLALESADHLDAVSEEADDNQWPDWSVTMRLAAERIRILAALSASPAPKDRDPEAEGVSVPPFADGGYGDRMVRAGTAFIEDYTMGREEGNDHEPDEHEREMLHDCFNGLMAEESFFGIVRALAASPSPLDGGWQPIETASKDGTWGDLWNRAGYRTTDVRWVNEDLSHDPRAMSGWKTRQEDQFSVLVENQFTHWRPLPSPPSTTEKEG